MTNNIGHCPWSGSKTPALKNVPKIIEGVSAQLTHLLDQFFIGGRASGRAARIVAAICD